MTLLPPIPILARVFVIVPMLIHKLEVIPSQIKLHYKNLFTMN